MMLKKRNVERKIKELLKLFPVVAIIGPRQCGKSTLVKSVVPDWKYYDLERENDLELISSDISSFLSRHPKHVIIDEAQELPQLFKELRGIVDQDRELCGRYILTGSSSPAIVKGLDESLAGRIATIELSTFKANEFFELPLSPLYQKINNGSSIDNFLQLKTHLTNDQLFSHWFKGGYPEPRIKSILSEDFSELWFENYLASYIRRDVQQLFPRLNQQRFRKFIQTLSFHSGNILNNSQIALPIEVSSTTIKDYLAIIHDTFIWRNLPSYEGNISKSVQKMPKGFFRDQGLLHYQLKLKSIDHLLLHPTAGSSFESFVIEEIIRGMSALISTNTDYYFYRTKDKAEVDLILDTPSGAIPIEIKLTSKINKRMLTALNNFIRETSAPYGILINNSDRVEQLSDTIIQIPATCL